MSEPQFVLYAAVLRHVRRPGVPMDPRGHWGFAFLSGQDNWHMWWLKHNGNSTPEIQHQIFYHELGHNLNSSQEYQIKHELGLVNEGMTAVIIKVIEDPENIPQAAAYDGEWWCKEWCVRVVHRLENEGLLKDWGKEPFLDKHIKYQFLPPGFVERGRKTER